MDLVSLLIFIIIVVAVVAIFQWFVRSSGITVPQPIMIVIYALIAVVCIIYIAHFSGIIRVW